MKKLTIICILLFSFIAFSQNPQTKACVKPSPTPEPTETPILSLQLRGE